MTLPNEPEVDADRDPHAGESAMLKWEEAVTVHILRIQGNIAPDIARRLSLDEPLVDAVLRGDVWPDAGQAARELLAGNRPAEG